MPNGRRRQTNTAHANRQRNLQRDLAVVDSIPVSVAPVVVEAMELSEVRAGEVKKLKGQIIGLKNKINNMDKQMSKLSELKERNQELSKSFNRSIKLCEEIKEERDHFEDELSKVSGLREQNKDINNLLKSSLKRVREERQVNEDLVKEMFKANKFLAHVSNELLGTKHDVTGSFEKLHDDLKGTNYDKLVEFIKNSHRLLNYMNIVMKKSREEEGRDLHFCDGDDVYVMKYIGKKDDVSDECVGVKVPTTGDTKKDYEVTTERDNVAKEMVEKIKKKRELKESALKNYSW